MALTPQDFASRWKRVAARETQTHPEHFLDLCHLAGHQTPNDYEPTGARFGFEMGAAKTSGGQGRCAEIWTIRVELQLSNS